MLYFVSILWRISQFKLSISLRYVSNISPSAGVLISHQTWETIIVRRRCCLAPCFAEPDTTFSIKSVERVSCPISFHAATYNIVANKSTRPLFLHAYLKFRYLCNATRRHDDYRDYIRKMGIAFGAIRIGCLVLIDPHKYLLNYTLYEEIFQMKLTLARDGYLAMVTNLIFEILKWQ